MLLSFLQLAILCDICVRPKYHKAQEFLNYLKQKSVKFSGNVVPTETIMYKRMLDSLAAGKISCIYQSLFPLPNEISCELPSLTADGVSTWSCVLVYPQFSTFDFIQSWNELDTFEDQLEQVLGQQRPDFL